MFALTTLLLVGLVGGLITGISPCVLPVLPVIFLSAGAQSARFEGPTLPGQPRPGTTPRRRPGHLGRGGREHDHRGRRPYLVIAGLALSFSVFTLLGTLTLDALPLPKDIIRWAGLAVLVLLGIGMIVPRLEYWLEKPFYRIPQRGVSTDRGGFVLGLALGAVYVPCAGPVLAAITVAGATGKIGGHTIALTAAFAVGTAIPLLFFALAGRSITERLRVFRSHQRRIRIGAGAVIIALAVALTFNVTDAIQRAIPNYTNGLNNAANTSAKVATVVGSHRSQSLAECVQESSNAPANPVLADCGAAPAIKGVTHWLNTPADAPLTLAGLKGKVVLVDFWAYSCINCQRAIQHVDAWYSAYRSAGFEVIGVHTPEYAFEQVTSNVAAGAKRLGISYPIAQDNAYATWDNYGNDSWPADYLIDATGTVRFVSIGEGNYDGTESLIRQLLTAANPTAVLPAATQVTDATPTNPNQTEETYLDAQRTNNFAEGDGSLPPGSDTFSYPSKIPDNEFGLTGKWDVGVESLTAKSGAGIRLHYDADDIYLDVGGTGTIQSTVEGKTTTYDVSGAPNIYQLLRRTTPGNGLVDLTLSPGLEVYSFTFG